MLSPIGYLRADKILEIRIVVMGLELRSVDSDSLGLCPVDSGSLW
jgi:hypothetical protein